MTNTASEAAAYEFTTLTVSGPTQLPSARFSFRQAIPGVLEYEGVKIQLLDLPGIVEGASQGTSQVINLVDEFWIRPTRSEELETG